MKYKLPRRSGPPHPTVVPAFAAFDEFVEQRLDSALGPDQKAQTIQGIDHLERAFMGADIPLQEFVDDDGMCAYIDQLEMGISPGYLAHLMGIWRQAFRYLCTKRLLQLDYSRCPVPADEKDPFDLSKVERGYPEAWVGVYPASIMPKHTARAIRFNAAVPEKIVHEYQLVIKNIPDRRRDATSVAWWFVVRQLTIDMRLKSLKELASVEGGARLMEYFLRKGYVRDAITIRKIRTLYNHLQNLGMCGNPFKLRTRQGEVMRYVIDFQRLPESSSKQTFFRIRGRRHTKIDGEAVECRLLTEDMKKIAQYGNPAVKSWRERPVEELEAAFREAQENLIARTVLFFPPRPIEFWSMGYGTWSQIEDCENGEFVMIPNNAVEHKRKRRPARPVPATYIRELEDLWKLRRALFAAKGDPDLKESFSPSMIHANVAMWIDPKTGRRLSRTLIVKALRRALLRAGVKESRAKRATLYWFRKTHQSFSRTHAKGAGDKLLAAQAGHSEETMKAKYDGAELLAQAEHMREHLWGPMEVMSAAPKPSGDTPRPATTAPSVAQYFQSADLGQLAAELLASSSSAEKPAELEAGELRRRVHAAALKAGLLSTFTEASQVLDLDIRTIERWADDNRVDKILIDGRRYILKAQINELAGCLSPDEAGRQLGLTGRQVRNLINNGELKGVIEMGKKWLIPLASLRAHQNSKGKR